MMLKNKISILLILFPVLTFSQQATINFNIINTSYNEISITNNDYANPEVMFGNQDFDLKLINGKVSCIFNFSKPVFITAYYRINEKATYSSYTFYLRPFDNLNFTTDLKNPLQSHSITGIGSENNQPQIQHLYDFPMKLDACKKDSLPYLVYNTIIEQSVKNKILFDNYIKTHNPSKEFIKTQNLLLQYFPLIEYIMFKGSQKFNIYISYIRNEKKWQAIEDSLLSVININNDELLNVPNYLYFISTYITRQKERIWEHPDLKNLYLSNTETATIFDNDPENLLMERIINKHFSKKTAEFLIADLFKQSLNNNEDNLQEIFERFLKSYPQSKYITYIEPEMIKVNERSKRILSNKMIFVENTDSLLTFDDVLKLFKGKTVLLDMWGTWCGPCRSEILINSDSIKNHFKNKNLNYLYIANYDENKVAKWKELIAYYNLTGTHILASKKLTDNIMKKLKRDEFPTYIIIKKDGTYDLSKAGYPMDRKILYKQLESALME